MHQHWQQEHFAVSAESWCRSYLALATTTFYSRDVSFAKPAKAHISNEEFYLHASANKDLGGSSEIQCIIV